MKECYGCKIGYLMEDGYHDIPFNRIKCLTPTKRDKFPVGSLVTASLWGGKRIGILDKYIDDDYCTIDGRLTWVSDLQWNLTQKWDGFSSFFKELCFNKEQRDFIDNQLRSQWKTP